MATRGPRTSFVRDNRGDPVVGLRIHKRKTQRGKPIERYYALLPGDARKYFGSSLDKTDAIFQFRQWEARQSKVLVDITVQGEPQPSITEGWEGVSHYVRLHELQDPKQGPLEWHRIPEDALWAKFATMLRETPLHLAAQKLGIPEIAHLRDVTPPEPSATCAATLQLYLTKRKQPSQEEIRKTKRAWASFVQVVNARTLADITQADIDCWENTLFSPYERGEAKAKTIRHKVQRVTKVLRYAVRKQQDAENASRILAIINKIDLPAADDVDPKPITPSDFERLLSAADSTWRCILLTSLNCCYYPKDICELPLDTINLAKGFVRFRRGKTGIARVAVLWPETKRAIRKYLLEHPHKQGTLILSARGGAYTYAGFRDAFDRLKRLAKAECTFDQVRDGAYTNACQTGVDERDAKILAGHRCGLTDAYVLRNPQRTKKAVDAIRKHYRIAEIAKKRFSSELVTGSTGPTSPEGLGIARLRLFSRSSGLGEPVRRPGLRPTLSAVAHSLRSNRASDGRQGPEKL